MGIVKILKNRRQSLGIPQNELAIHCGFLHRSTVSRLEAGKIEWKLRDAMKACELLNLKIEVKEVNNE